MPVPTPVGRIHPNEPRAVMVRDPENQNAPHSAIFSGLNIFTESSTETKFLMDRWAEIIDDFSGVIDMHLAEFAPMPMGETDGD